MIPPVVNLVVTLDEARFGPAALAAVRRDAASRGLRLVRVDGGDGRLEAWIDWTFAPSWWSSEVRSGSAWYAERDGTILGFAGFGARGLRFSWLRGWDRPAVGIFGPLGIAPGARRQGIGRLLLMAALASLRADRKVRALIPAVGEGVLSAMYERLTGATIADRYTLDQPRRRRAVILASGNGTNAQAVFDSVAEGYTPLDIAALVANDATAPVVTRAQNAGVPAVVQTWNRAAEPRSAYDARVIDAVRAAAPELVLLLGWMHLLPPAFLDAFPETLNVHPAFLPFDPQADEVTLPDGSRQPAFRGARAVEAAFATGARWLGASVHQVTAETDRGAIVVRTPLQLTGETTPAAIVPRLRLVEHAAVLSAIRRWTFEAGA